MNYSISIIVYVSMGIIGSIALKKTRTNYAFRNSNKQISYYYFFWFIIWTLFISSRIVTDNFGGTDAPRYIKFFINSMSDEQLILGDETMEKHMGVVFSFLTKIIRCITKNYHMYFSFIYGFITISYIIFLNEFSLPDECFIPLIPCFFPLLLGFNTLRSTFSIALILIAIVLIKRKYYKTSLLFLILSCSVHKASFVYVLFFPYYFLSKKDIKSIWKTLIGLIFVFFVGRFVQNILFNSSLGIISSAYRFYLGKSYSRSILQWQPVILFSQFLLFINMIVFWRNIKIDMDKENEDSYRLRFLWMLCSFDILVIPICYIVNNFRGYEYFYLARLLMWGEIFKIIKQKCPKYLWYLIEYCILILFIGWYIFRISRNANDAHLFPYKSILFDMSIMEEQF